ncbi:MAG: putative Fe-S oxidoreductase [halophilic archaeon J07HX64]|jgi:Predicted Fe-S oxidoreductases|nr:MAG: putative Fe-S oxidoreductase [halophilic archaeon J07HX64]
MSEAESPLETTTSLCPECLEQVPGTYVAREESVYLQRNCPDHGEFDRKVWDSLEHWRWAKQFQPDAAFDPDGDWAVDNDHACLAVVEVTQNCNLSCSYCFASSGPGGYEHSSGEVHEMLETVLDSGGPRPIQFSGGEPTVREDLPELVADATEMGFEHIQVNTNGIRLATESGYAQQLADAGVSAIYLQFDGLEAETYEAIREVDLVSEKHAAIEACRAAGLSVVLVPTVVPGTNDHEMGPIVEFALDNRDVIESVNFQPVAHFGRVAEHQDRFSLDEAARRLADQFDSIEPRDLMPVPCCSSYCQTATALLPTPGGIVPATRFLSDALFTNVSGMVDESDWMEMMACTPTGKSSATNTANCCGPDVDAVTGMLGGAGGCCGGTDSDAVSGEVGELMEQVLPVSFTGFMDADAADAGRLDNCCVSVPAESGELVPFCAYNMTTDTGEYAIRNREGWGGRPAVGEPFQAEAEAETEETHGDD